ncbi:hypothetical protein ACWDTP_22000 [Mycobacterium sp. NPDC003449]
MSPQTFTAAPGPVVLARSRPPERHRVLRYELNVAGSGAVDLVSGIGGWLFDQRMAGWHIGICLGGTVRDDRGAERALRILGAKTVELHGLWTSMADAPEAVVLTVIETGRFQTDDDVRLRGLTALREGAGEIAFWGAGGPGPMVAARPVHYRLSAAARAFKAHALAALDADPASAGWAETVYRCGGVSTPQR